MHCLSLQRSGMVLGHNNLLAVARKIPRDPGSAFLSAENMPAPTKILRHATQLHASQLFHKLVRIMIGVQLCPNIVRESFWCLPS